MTVQRLIKHSGRQCSGYSDLPPSPSKLRNHVFSGLFRLAVSSLNLMLKPCNGFICPRHIPSDPVRSLHSSGFRQLYRQDTRQNGQDRTYYQASPSKQTRETEQGKEQPRLLGDRLSLFRNNTKNCSTKKNG